MDERLEREVLEGVLDNDAVQHLLINIENNGIASKEDTLAAVNRLASNQLLKFSQYDYLKNTEQYLDAQSLSMKYIQSNTYTFLNRTEFTLDRLNELNRMMASKTI